MDKIFKLLNEIIKNIEREIELIETEEDGRVNSMLSEKNILKLIESYCGKERIKFIPHSNFRSWYDFALEYEGKFVPVNIKISKCNSCDNVSSKEGMLFAITGLMPNSSNCRNWNVFNKTLADNRNKELDTDYYFIVINKKTKEVFPMSLLSANSLIANGNNLPFQINWGKNKTISEKNRKESIKYVF